MYLKTKKIINQCINMTEVNSRVSENANLRCLSPNKSRRIQSAIFYSKLREAIFHLHVSNRLISLSGRENAALCSTRGKKKKEKGPTIYSFSRVWNITALSTAKLPSQLVWYRWNYTSNEALRVTQSPKTIKKLFSCAICLPRKLSETLIKSVLHWVYLGYGQTPSIQFD